MKRTTYIVAVINNYWKKNVHIVRIYGTEEELKDAMLTMLTEYPEFGNGAWVTGCQKRKDISYNNLTKTYFASAEYPALSVRVYAIKEEDVTIFNPYPENCA